jgi:hypothetical protein
MAHRVAVARSEFAISGARSRAAARKPSLRRAVTPDLPRTIYLARVAVGGERRIQGMHTRTYILVCGYRTSSGAQKTQGNYCTICCTIPDAGGSLAGSLAVSST